MSLPITVLTRNQIRCSDKNVFFVSCIILPDSESLILRISIVRCLQIVIIQSLKLYRTQKLLSLSKGNLACKASPQIIYNVKAAFYDILDYGVIKPISTSESVQVLTFLGIFTAEIVWKRTECTYSNICHKTYISNTSLDSTIT